MSENDGTTHELQMPFVACLTNGGTYEDRAFVAGWECGALDARLQAVAGLGCIVERWVNPDLIPQLDLIAMRHGLALHQIETSEDGEYVRVHIGVESLIRPREDDQ